jgi:hypothetical protein
MRHLKHLVKYKKMKTKPITLILTLLFCLSGSVFAEEESISENIIPLKNLNAHILKLEKMDVYKEGNAANSIAKLRQAESDMDWISQLQYKVKDVKSSLIPIVISLKYEQIILVEKIDNSKLMQNHHTMRKLNFSNANKNIDFNLKGFKYMKGLITHSTAKSTIALLVEEVESIEKWLKMNMNFQFKWEK